MYKVVLVQTEQTFSVVDSLDNDYTVMITSDLINGFMQYDIFDDEGNEVRNEDFKAELMAAIEETL
jgi:hypothetical protein